MNNGILDRMKSLHTKPLPIHNYQETKPQTPSKVVTEWNFMSKAVYLLRLVHLRGVRYAVFFVYTPTLFKTRGKYLFLEESDREKMLQLACEYKDYKFMGFTIPDSGVLCRTNSVPTILLDAHPEQFLDVYKIDNSVLEIHDLLDLLDFIDQLGGYIHLNPFRGIEKLKKYMKEDSEFRLGDSVNDYRQDIRNFVTSREKPTLSYGFLLVGTEVVDGKKYDRKKFFQYPLLSDYGEVIVDELEFTVPNTPESVEGIKRHLLPYLQEGSVTKMEYEIYFRIDTSKLKPIVTVHELPITLDLINFREETRLTLRSLREFKRLVREMSIRVGVPIRREENLFVYDKVVTDSKSTIETRLTYKNDDTRAGDSKFKDILEKTGMKSLKYVESIIERYLEGKIDNHYLNRVLHSAGKVFHNPILNTALQSLFVCIDGSSLGEMYDKADHQYKVFDCLGNSLKMKLHAFGMVDEPECLDFTLRMLSSGIEDVTNNLGSVTFNYEEFNERGSITYKTIIKS